ncbi:MAG: sigma factor-like helix-turn-helix DNA-binding protein [Candidatus Thorarchaeota archaeon]
MSSGKLRNLTKKKLNQLYAIEQKPMSEIAEIYNCTIPAIRTKMSKFDIDRRTSGQSLRIRHGTNHITKEVLHDLYWNKKLTQSEIGRMFNISQSAIKYRMQKYNIQARTLSELARGVNNSMYGKTHTKEAREKIREANRIQFSDPENRRKHGIITAKQIADGRTGKKHNKLEKKVASILLSHNINFTTQHRIGRFVYDFLLTDYNILIEAQGTFWHGDPRKYDYKKLKAVQLSNIERDVRKAVFALENNHKLIYLWEHDVHYNTHHINKILNSITHS